MFLLLSVWRTGWSILAAPDADVCKEYTCILYKYAPKCICVNISACS